jgi:hypothetical protein
MTHNMSIVLFLLCFLTFITITRAEDGKEYNAHDDVPVIATKVGPYANPSETYPYYSLPFCQPPKVEREAHGLGEVLAGDHKVKTLYALNFKADLSWYRLCKKKLAKEDIKRLQTAVDEEYFFELLIDGLPVWGYVGDSDKETDLILSSGSLAAAADPHKYVHAHFHFSIGYNGNRIVEVNLTADPTSRIDVTGTDHTHLGPESAFMDMALHPASIVDEHHQDPHPAAFKANSEGDEVEFSYSVKWLPSDIPYEKRMERYDSARFLPASFEIHWLSIINSFVLVILLTVFLAIILMRVLKNDFTRYMREDEGEDLGMSEDETGWKLLHGDVFRFPPYVSLFTAMLGAGTQLLCMVGLLLMLALLSVYSPTAKGAIATAAIVLYSLTAGAGGFVAGRMYKQFGGTNWVWNTILTASLFPVPTFVVFVILNSAAWSRGATAALPIGTILIIIALNLLVTFPLTIVGAIVGRSSTGEFEAPCRTTKVPRQIPEAPWFRQMPAQMFVAGFLPFSAIYIETHHIFSSVWGHKLYTLFGILFLAMVLLIIVTSFITIALTYFQLAIEDHRWWWRSFFSGGSTALFVMAYSFFFFFGRSEMSGSFQTAFFFLYMSVVCWGIFLLLGTVGFFSSLSFVRLIFSQIKVD